MKQDKLLLAFCINDMIEAQAVIAAAKKTNQQICLMVTENAICFAGYSYLLAILQQAKKEHHNKILIELDHGRDVELIKRCIEDNFDIVMIDKSDLSFRENVAATQEIVALAHKKGIAVEAAIGRIGNKSKGKEDVAGGRTELTEAQKFLSQTQVDYLAISVNNYHGDAEEKPQLAFDHIEHLADNLSCPLVLHGSDFIPDESLRKAVKHGIQKINFGPELRLTYWQSIVRSVNEITSDDPRDAFKLARQEVQEVVEERIKKLNA